MSRCWKSYLLKSYMSPYSLLIRITFCSLLSLNLLEQRVAGCVTYRTLLKNQMQLPQSFDHKFSTVFFLSSFLIPAHASRYLWHIVVPPLGLATTVTVLRRCLCCNRRTHKSIACHCPALSLIELNCLALFGC